MKDFPGQAIHDFHFQEGRSKLYVHDTFGPKVEMPVSYYFRNLKKMPQLEQLALSYCKGKVLDIGAAAGSHALQLQRNGREATALDISPLSCEVMKDRGIEKVICEDFFKFHDEPFDTLLLLMNGVGISSDLQGFRELLKKAKSLLTPDGQLIFDSCDIEYMYEDTPMPQDKYYGSAKVRYEYKKEYTDWFEWLYLDPQTMSTIAKEEGWNSDIVYKDQNHQFLAVLKL